MAYLCFCLGQEDSTTVDPVHRVNCLEAEVVHLGNRAKVGAYDSVFDIERLLMGLNLRSGFRGRLLMWWWGVVE